MQDCSHYMHSQIFLCHIAYFALRYTGRNVHTQYESEKLESANESLLPREEDAMQISSAFKLTKQILANRNFLSFVLMNFFQVNFYLILSKVQILLQE